jgi:Uma2 family endonuclease
MNVALPKPWSVEQFLAWAESQDGRYEFDGLRPVAMTGGSANQSRITPNIHGALRNRLRGTSCASFGPDLGIRTDGNAIRYPDALITCTTFAGTEKIAPDVVVVFEVLSSESGRRDRIGKTREYGRVDSIRSYVIVESTSPGLTVLYRDDGGDTWRARVLTGSDTLTLSMPALEIPVAEFYEDVDFGIDPAQAQPMA